MPCFPWTRELGPRQLEACGMYTAHGPDTQQVPRAGSMGIQTPNKPPGGLGPESQQVRGAAVFQKEVVPLEDSRKKKKRKPAFKVGGVLVSIYFLSVSEKELKQTKKSFPECFAAPLLLGVARSAAPSGPVLTSRAVQPCACSQRWRCGSSTRPDLPQTLW